MITSSGKILPNQTELVKLETLFSQYARSREQVYKQVILGNQEWFKKGDPQSYRSQLINQGWSQREATSIYKSVTNQLSANRENLNSSRDKLQIKLGKTIKELVKSKQAKPYNKGRVRCLNERVQRLNARIQRIEKELEQDYPNLYFTRKDTILALQDPIKYGYKNYQEARVMFERERDSQYFVEGDRQALYGNYSARILLDPEKHKGGTVILNNPFGENITLVCKGFSHKQGRYEILAAQERYQIQHGGKTQQKLNVCQAPVSVRVYWSKKYQDYYVQVSVPRTEYIIKRAKELRLEQELKKTSSILEKLKSQEEPKHVSHDYVLGVDLNPNHVAYCLVKKDGNPLPKHSGRINLYSKGSKGQRKHSLGNSVKQLLQVHKELETQYGPILLASEKLNFKQGKKTNIPGLNNTLNTFAYSQFKRILSHRLLETSIDHVEVNPAYTSKIGQLNYSNPYGVSVDIGASIVIARKGLNYKHRLRPIVRAGFTALVSKTIKTKPVKGKAKHVNQYTQICDHIGGRDLTWGTGLLNRVQVLEPPTLCSLSPRP